MRRWTWSFAVWVLALIFSLDAWAEPVRVRTSSGDGYGRLTFVWSAPVGHQAQKDGDRLVVMFSRPIEADLRPAIRGLGKYIRSAEPAPNDATIVLRVKGDFSVRSYDSGSSVVVDIVGGGENTSVAAPTEQPAAASAPATPSSGPNVPVRTGAHDEYTRIVFDWPSATKFEVLRDGAKATIRFDKHGRADVSRLLGQRVRNITSARAQTDDGNLSVVLNVDATSQIKAFASGPKVVVDVYRPGTQAASPTAQPLTSAKAQAAQPPAPKPAPVTPVETVQTAPVDGASSSQADSGAVSQEQTQTQAQNQDQAGDAPLKLSPDAQPLTMGGGDRAADNAEPRVQTRAEASQITEGAVALKFNWDEPVGAAVFRRGENLWVVFDKRATIDTEALLKDGQGTITSVEQVPSRNGAVLRMTTPESINPGIKRAGLSWVLEFMPQPLIPSAPLEVDAQPNSPLGARVFIAVPEPGNVIAFRDPDIGDNLAAVPVIPLGHGVSRPWTYPQMQLLPSKQGVILKPKSDDLRIRPLRQGVEVTSTGTLQISAVSAEDKANVELQQQLAVSAGMQSLRPLTRVLDLEKWKRPDLASFNETKQDLLHTVSLAKGDRERTQAHRELMQFFFANGFTVETIGVLEEMARIDPNYAKEPEYNLIHGAVSWLMGRMEDARRDLFNASLDPYDEATFWRAAVAAKEGELADTAYELRQTGAITQPYPKALKMPMATLVADAAVELGDVRQAKQYIEVLSVDNPSESQKNQITYVSGRLKALSGDVDGAVADWEKVMEGRHRPSRARAAVARTELLLEHGMFTPADAIDEFEKLRFVWRGDKFEFALLRRLGALYLEQQQYRNGLRTLRQAATYFPDHKDTNQVTKKMSDTFQMLYLEDGADVLPPVTAIALYDEFRELTPAGELGDEMIRRLADRLVQVDLLDRAADLLESQVDFRLKGELKARVGARLALIYLFDRKYQKTIDSLNKTQMSGLNEALASERTLLRAQAYVGLEQPETALELLVPEISKEAELIRTGIYWQAGDWKNASRSLTQLVRVLEAKPRKPLDETQSVAVLWLSVAMTLSGNEVGVSRMVANYGPAMSQTRFADAFKLIADPPERGLVNYRSLEPIVKKVENFQGFMEVYRQRVADGQLSSLY